MGFSLGGAFAGGMAGYQAGGPWGALGGGLLGGFMGGDANDQSDYQARVNRDFNSAEAAKTREWQEQMRKTQYQTAIEDLQKAGLSPMLAYTNGGAGNINGATAAAGGLPHMENRVTAALTNAAQMAAIKNTDAQTSKTIADKEVSEAMAKKVEADTNVSTNSATNIAQDTERLREVVNQVKENVQLQRQQTNESRQREVLGVYQAKLADIQTKLEQKRISLVDAQTEMSKVATQLSRLEVPKAKNQAEAQGSWWMKNVSPYLDDSSKATGTAGKIFQFMR